MSVRASLVLLTLLVTGCASHDATDRYLLGAATSHNIAVQSVRPVNQPEARPVEHGPGAGLGAANRPGQAISPDEEPE